MKKYQDNFWAKNIASLVGLGMKTSFPGTLASFISLIFIFLVYYFLNQTIYTILFLIILIKGIWAINKIRKDSEQKDYPWIVIDECIGMWIVGFFLFEIHLSSTHMIFIALLIFIIFRIIDIFKFIPPINTINEKIKQTTATIILDDIIAGIYSYIILMILFGFYNIQSVYSVFLILLTPMVANMTPVLLRNLNKFNKPIHVKMFGQNKTWRGFIGGVIVGTLFYYFLIWIGLVDKIPNTNSIIYVGFFLSFGALLGDLIKSYFKRNIHMPEGASWMPLDQIDYVLGAVIFTYPIYRYHLSEIILMLTIGGIASALAHHFAYFTKMINTKW